MTSEQEYNRTKVQTDKLVGYFIKDMGDEYRVVEMPKYAPMDYQLFRGDEHIGYIEVKFRSHRKGHYKLEKIPFSKYTFAFWAKHKEDKKCFLLEKWNDKVGIIDIMDVAQVKTITARSDRGDELDLYALYDHKKFKVMDRVWDMFVESEGEPFYSGQVN